MAEATEADKRAALDLCIDMPGVDFTDGRGWDELVGFIAKALDGERAKARAPFLALADEMESDGKGDSGFMEYHEGFNAALVNAARSIRHAAQDPT